MGVRATSVQDMGARGAKGARETRGARVGEYNGCKGARGQGVCVRGAKVKLHHLIFLLGEKNVMVDTIHFDDGSFIFNFYDKHIFRLTVEYHEPAFYGILCEQGISVNLISLVL